MKPTTKGAKSGYARNSRPEDNDVGQYKGHVPYKNARVGTLPDTTGAIHTMTSKVVTGSGAGAKASISGGMWNSIHNGPKVRA